jgi:hypothetical protein
LGVEVLGMAIVDPVWVKVVINPFFMAFLSLAGISTRPGAATGY